MRFNRYKKTDIPIGGILEISKATNEIAINISNIIQKYTGAIFIADYGYINSNYISTIQSIYKHQYNDILENISQSDITYHVDFGNLYNIFCNKKGECNLHTQREFLLTFGIMQHFHNLHNSNQLDLQNIK